MHIIAAAKKARTRKVILFKPALLAQSVFKRILH
jgi:hypothetical protein